MKLRLQTDIKHSALWTLMLQMQLKKEIHENAENKRVLHIAPYYCLQERRSHLS